MMLAKLIHTKIKNKVGIFIPNDIFINPVKGVNKKLKCNFRMKVFEFGREDGEEGV